MIAQSESKDCMPEQSQIDHASSRQGTQKIYSIVSPIRETILIASRILSNCRVRLESDRKTIKLRPEDPKLVMEARTPLKKTACDVELQEASLLAQGPAFSTRS